MTKSELIATVATVAEEKKIPTTKVGAIINTALEIIQDTVSGGESVNLPGFGKFILTERAARKGRNPQTGEAMDIAATNLVKFKPAKAFKEYVN